MWTFPNRLRGFHKIGQPAVDLGDLSGAVFGKLDKIEESRTLSTWKGRRAAGGTMLRAYPSGDLALVRADRVLSA
ncbi:hypothetical protein ACQP2E_16295 [Actinoplanes sp. CA-015351]|uniref:hypothetical protein n=1 Tax=Actinoplanes sp. CA-015351 TaxID=3239897 RepID=UPI003D970DC9